MKVNTASTRGGLVSALGLRSGDLAALVGGGGKSSLMFAIGRAFPGRVILTTTTRIFTRQMHLAPSFSLAGQDAGEVDARLHCLLTEHGRCLVVGEVWGGKARGIPPDLPRRWLERGLVELVVVEADGSRRRPIKAPGAHEPVIPTGTTLLIPMVGIDALGKPAQVAAHRPELVSLLTGLGPSEPLTVAAMARLMLHPDGGLKGLQPNARCVCCINKVETPAALEAAREIAQLLLVEPCVERVVITAARRREKVRDIIVAGEQRKLRRDQAGSIS